MKTCSEEGCNKPHYGHGMCQAHYRRYMNSLKITGPIRARRQNGQGKEYRKCCAHDCERAQHAKGFCSHHYYFVRKPA